MSNSSVGRDTKMPDFLIIGAMKCATTTLYDQLSRQPGIFMPALKEPNFFSDDGQYIRGLEWYEELFSSAEPGDIIGEASTHYTKLPNYPATIARIKKDLPEVRLIYVMRHPIERLISQYIHEWSCGKITVSLERALDSHPELVAYSRYSYQLLPYIKEFGAEKILPVFFERMKSDPQKELERIAEFIGYENTVFWSKELKPKNVSRERIRRFPFYNFIMQNQTMASMRRMLVPKMIRNAIKQQLQMDERPTLSEASTRRVEEIFNHDLSNLGNAFGVTMNLQNYFTVVTSKRLEWVRKSASSEPERPARAESA